MFEDWTPRRAVELAVHTEQIGYTFYDTLARRFAQSAEVEQIFAQLARDERGHEARFKALLERLPAELDDAEPERELYLKAVAFSTVLDKDSFKGIDGITTPADALARAIHFEKSTLVYYLAIRDLIGASPALDTIIAEERKHITNLFRVVMTDGQFRSVDDSF